MLTNVTAIVKTFERPECLTRLISSLRLYYPELLVLIADDSRKPIVKTGPNLQTYGLPYDSGLSVGRNFLLSKVTTDYFLLLDDDFVFTADTSLESLYAYLQKGFDLIAGAVRDTQQIPFHIGNIVMLNGQASVDIITPVAELTQCTFVPNFFMAKTTAVRAVGWKNELKLSEHVDFFARALGKLKLGYCASVVIDHNREPRSPFYRSMRNRTSQFQKLSIPVRTLVRDTRRPFFGRR